MVATTLSLGAVVKAEEEVVEETTTSETVAEPKKDVSYNFNDFVDDALAPLITALSGLGVLGFGWILLKKKLTTLEKTNKASNKEVAESKAQLKEIQVELLSQKDQMLDVFDGFVKSASDILAENEAMLKQINNFKYLLALFITSNPDYIKNDYVKQMLDYLQDDEQEVVVDEENKSQQD